MEKHIKRVVLQLKCWFCLGTKPVRNKHFPKHSHPVVLPIEYKEKLDITINILRFKMPTKDLQNYKAS